MDKQGRKTDERARRRRDRFWDFIVPKLITWSARTVNYSHDDFEPSSIEGPVIVAINHSCAYDPLFMGISFHHKRLTYIASEHIMRTAWGRLLDRYAYLIPHSKGAKSSRTALVTMKRIKRGESVFLAVEGEQTWDGEPLPVMPYTGKLVKGSGATLVTYVIEGGYLAFPRWARHPRKGKVYGHPANVYSPEVLAGMSDEEVEQAIARDLAFSVWDWQKSRPEGPVHYRASKGGNADGLERAVCACPECRKIGGLRSSGDIVSCRCGFKIRLTDTGWFGKPAPFDTIVDWEKFDREVIREGLAGLRASGAEGAELFGDEGAELFALEGDHSEKSLGRGRISVSFEDGGFALKAAGRSFSIDAISNMTLVLSSRIVFSDESGYYEIRSKDLNLRKYVITRDVISKGKED